MKQQLIFSTTDAQSLLDSDNVGAYVRSSDGTLITKHDGVAQLKAQLVSQGLVFKSKLPGVIGNTYSFEVVDTGGAGPLAFTEIGGDIVLDLVGLTPTVAQVVSALAGNTYIDVTAGSPTGLVVVAAAQSLAGGENSSLHKYLDVFSILADANSTPLTSTLIGTKQALDVNIAEGINVEIDINGIYDVSTNPTPDNVGMIAHTRNAAIGAAQQVERTSAGALATIAAASLANVKALDVNSFMYAIDDVSGDAELLSKDATSNGLNVHLAGSDIELKTSDIANTAVFAAANVLNVANTAEDAVVAPLANRKFLFIHNNFNKKVFIGQSGVTTANGFPLAPQFTLELRAGPAIDIEFVGQTGDLPEIRTLELS